MSDVYYKRWWYKTYRSLGLCVQCGEEALSSGQIRCWKHMLQHDGTSNGHYHRLKAQIYDRYGNKCQCCGESNKAFLSIDHVHGGGAAHKRKVGMGAALLKAIWEEADQSKYRLLCFNCNCARGFRGFCPHEVGADVNVLA